MSFISNKSQKTPHSVIREMFALQTGLDNVISFALGEPDFTAPQHVIDATVASLQRGETHYTPNAGIPALRQAVSDLYKRRGLDYKPSEVLIGAGAISMLNIACTAMLDIGDEVQPGDIAGTVNGQPMKCTIGGVVRGILPSGTPVHRGMKSGDVDPRCQPEYCTTASDKALAVGGGALEAILHLTGALR